MLLKEARGEVRFGQCAQKPTWFRALKAALLGFTARQSPGILVLGRHQSYFLLFPGYEGATNFGSTGCQWCCTEAILEGVFLSQGVQVHRLLLPFRSSLCSLLLRSHSLCLLE